MSWQPQPIQRIQHAVALRTGIEVAQLRGKSRRQPIARARQMAMWLARRLTDASLPEIGRVFGGRDHTTVLHAIHATDARRVADPGTARNLDALEGALREVLTRHAAEREWGKALGEAARQAVDERFAELGEQVRAEARRDPLAVMERLGRLAAVPGPGFEDEDATRL